MKLAGNYGSQIDSFKTVYLRLGITVTPCVHILTAHTSEFFDLCARSGEGGRGLGLYSEQSFEAMHYLVSRVQERFPANKFGSDFAKRALRAMCYVNSTHI